MSTQVDEGTVRQFLQMHHHYAANAINSGTDPGLLQLVRIHPDDESISVSRYALGDTDRMAADAIAAANAGHNVYVEGRTVRKELRGNKRGALEDTLWVFALVADCDAGARPATSLSPRHLWSRPRPEIGTAGSCSRMPLRPRTGRRSATSCGQASAPIRIPAS
jgi:hypothetical protein